jgi:hypothetical protein
MKRTLLVIALVLALSLMVVAPAFAEDRPGFCSDLDDDGKTSGYEYAQGHIVDFAREGKLGQGHKPGEAHHGFSTCLAFT